MCDEEDNTPYRLTEAYRKAAANAAKQNARQRRGLDTRYAPMFDGEPWGVPDIYVLHSEINSPIHPFGEIIYATFYFHTDE